MRGDLGGSSTALGARRALRLSSLDLYHAWTFIWCAWFAAVLCHPPSKKPHIGRSVKPPPDASQPASQPASPTPQLAQRVQFGYVCYERHTRYERYTACTYVLMRGGLNGVVGRSGSKFTGPGRGVGKRWNDSLPTHFDSVSTHFVRLRLAHPVRLALGKIFRQFPEQSASVGCKESFPEIWGNLPDHKRLTT
eukprot:3030223-Prymnesium_polylepis.1